MGYDFTLEETRNTRDYFRKLIKAYKDPTLTSSCSKDFMEWCEHFEFILDGKVQSMERRGKDKETLV